MGGTTPKAILGGPPRPKRWETPPWFKTLKPSHAKVFSWEFWTRWETPPWFKTLKPSHVKVFSWNSNMVREARREFFLKHSYNLTTDDTHDLSRTFRQLTVSADLLDTSIHEIQASWTGPKELKQANYALRSLPKGLKFLHTVPPQNLLRSWDW